MGSSSSTPASSEPTRGTSDGPAGAPIQKEPTPDLSHAVAPPPLTATLPTGDETASKKLENPGDFEELGKRVKDSFPVALDGYKLILNKGLSRFFQTSHTLVLPSDYKNASYQFGGVYTGTKQISENEYRPMMMGEYSTNGNFMMVFAHQLTKSLKCRVNMQQQESKWVAYQGQFDQAGSDYTASMVVANPDITDYSVIAAGQYLQAITPSLALGAEYMLQRAQGVEGATLSLGGKYATKNWEAAGKVGLLSWDLSYLHKATDSLTFLSNLEGNTFQGDSKFTFGYSYDIPNSNLQFKSSINSHWVVTASMEKRLDPLPGSVMFTGQLDHVKKESKFGVGILIG